MPHQNADALINQAKKKPGNFTVNAVTGEIVSAVESGIIDPTKVVRQSVINAVSAALNLMTVKCVAVIEREEDLNTETEIFINENV